MNEEQGVREKTFEEKTKEEILVAFLLVNDYRILTNEELKDVKKAINNLQQENVKLKQQLKDKDEKISKALNKISERCDYIKDEYEDSFDCCIEELSNIEKILESNKED